MEEITTLEQAQARIIELQEDVTRLTTERDALSQNNSDLSGELERVRTINQQYFNKLSAQYSPEADKKDDGEEVPTCEEFAKTITF